jgi:hypothetical protein
MDSLWVLAHSFSDGKDVNGIKNFVKAYVSGGTVKRLQPQERNEIEDIHSGPFLATNLTSNRMATKPRDYIFATMPQFPWYHYPLNAETLSFNDIFLDLHEQASHSGHAFAYKFTESMTNAAVYNDPQKAWLLSQNQPEPRCLGDFLKLLGYRLPIRLSPVASNVHFTRLVRIGEFDNDHPDVVLAVLENSMRFSRQEWRGSHEGGELSKYGNFPSTEWILNDFDALHAGWVRTNQGTQIRVIERRHETEMIVGPSIDYEEDELYALMAALLETLHEEESLPYVTLMQQSMKILDHFWCSEDDIIHDGAQRSDWASYKRQMRGNWSQPLLRTILLLGAMIGCKVGLSAAAWANRLFVPVYVECNDTILLALLAKHARPSDQSATPWLMIVGRHTSGGISLGKDLFLVDPETKVPVGLLPDFLPDRRSDEVYSKRVQLLYDSFVQSADPRATEISVPPLRGVEKRIWPH